MKIITHHWLKPIPMRDFDWTATYEDYDGAEDSRTRAHIGYGATEQEAIDDLVVNFPDMHIVDAMTGAK
jgi:hypothetical protein